MIIGVSKFINRYSLLVLVIDGIRVWIDGDMWLFFNGMVWFLRVNDNGVVIGWSFFMFWNGKVGV